MAPAAVRMVCSAQIRASPDVLQARVATQARRHQAQPQARKLVTSCVRENEGEKLFKATLAAGYLTALTLAGAPEARALTTQELVDGANTAYKALSSGVTTLIDVSKDAVELAKPYVEKAVPIVQKAGEEVLKASTPVVTEAAKTAGKALQEISAQASKSLPDVSGAEPAVKTASAVAESAATAATNAAPVVSSFLVALSQQELPVLGLEVVLVALAFWSAPAFGGAFLDSLRGYAGEVTPAQALDLVTQSNSVLVDLRTENDKIRSGIPSLPRGASKRSIAIPTEEIADKSVRNSLRDARAVEYQITAIKLSSLKQLNAGSQVLLLDRYGGEVGKPVAKQLTKLGFNNVFTIRGGYEGSGGWIKSNLGTEVAMIAEVVTPARIFSGGSSFVNSKALPSGTTGTGGSTKKRLSLPGQ